MIPYLRIIDADLKRYLKSLPGNPKTLYQPIRYALAGKGKRIRPLMALIGAGITGRQATLALPVARSVELFHNFTLLHDDIMDRSPLRRGKPTVHKKFGSNQAILSGDVMFSLAQECLNEIKGDPGFAIRELFSKTAREVCEGQQMDMDFEKREMVSQKEYMLMIRKKTAVLLGASLSMGALSTGAGSPLAERLYTLGTEAGILFQIMDDLLDTFGATSKTGKRRGQDLRSGKKTWLIVSAAGYLKNELNRKQFYKALKKGEEGKLRKTLEELKIDDKTREFCRKKALDLKRVLTTIPPGSGRDHLQKLLENLLTRES